MHLRTAILLFILLPFSALAATKLPLSQLSDAERSYYDMVFDYTMEVTKSNQYYEWQGFNGNGRITPGDNFVSKSGYSCRPYSQSFTIAGQRGTDTGIACKRAGRDGWCRLKEGNALTCAMEDRGLFDVGAPSMPGMPSINAPSLGGGGVDPDIHISRPGLPSNLDAPDVEKPTATGYADTVTGAAGEAAGGVARNAGGWFNSLFR
jgi:hypothetical protein